MRSMAFHSVIVQCCKAVLRGGIHVKEPYSEIFIPWIERFLSHLIIASEALRTGREGFILNPHFEKKKKSRKPKGQRMMICKCLAKIRVQRTYPCPHIYEAMGQEQNTVNRISWLWPKYICIFLSEGQNQNWLIFMGSLHSSVASCPLKHREGLPTLKFRIENLFKNLRIFWNPFKRHVLPKKKNTFVWKRQGGVF